MIERRELLIILAFLLFGEPEAGSASPAIPEVCGAKGDDIVVCGSRRTSPYRLPKLPDRYEAPRLRAETSIAPGVNASAHVDPVTLPGGVQSNRVMATIKIPF